MGELLAFYGLAGLITICSLLVVTLRNPVGSLVLLVVDFFLLAGIYALQGADFIAAIQIIIYTGAVLILFMFVIMLLHLDLESLKAPKRSIFEYFGFIVLASGFFYILYKALPNDSARKFAVFKQTVSDVDNTKEIALKLFNDYLWPFELASLLILLAVVASMLIAQRYKQPS